MGLTRFAGPVYGAKTALLKCHLAGDQSTSTSAIRTYQAITVPAGEDWFITGLGLSVGSTASTGYEVSVVDESSRVRTSTGVVSSLRKGSSLADRIAFTASSAMDGEYEGTRIATGSTVVVRAVQQSSIATTNINVTVYGFRRFVSSTRTEG